MLPRTNGGGWRVTDPRDSLQTPCLPHRHWLLPPAAMSMPLTPGFQNSSANTTRSAEEKVRPMLAAVMDSTATACLSDSWKCWHSWSRSAEDVAPSMRMCGTFCRSGGGATDGGHRWGGRAGNGTEGDWGVLLPEI